MTPQSSLPDGVRPIKVTAVLNGPVGGEVPMLDALLECVMSRRMRTVWESSNGHRHYTRLAGSGAEPPQMRGVKVVPGAIPIPIMRRHVAGFAHPVPLCSSPIYLTANDRHEHYARRFDVSPDLIGEKDRRVFQAASGEFKSFRLPLRTRLIDRVVWFCAGRTGNARAPMKEIRRLLREIKYLGKKTSQGYGEVAEWIVEPADEDWSWFAPSPVGPVLMRPLPPAVVPADVVGARPWFGGIVPPYWMAEAFADGMVPC